MPRARKPVTPFRYFNSAPEVAPKRHGSLEAITTDGPCSYGAAMDELGNREKQETGRWANNALLEEGR